MTDATLAPVDPVHVRDILNRVLGDSTVGKDIGKLPDETQYRMLELIHFFREYFKASEALNELPRHAVLTTQEWEEAFTLMQAKYLQVEARQKLLVAEHNVSLGLLNQFEAAFMTHLNDK